MALKLFFTSNNQKRYTPKAYFVIFASSSRVNKRFKVNLARKGNY